MPQDQFIIDPKSLVPYELMQEWLLPKDLILTVLDQSPVDSSRMQDLVFLLWKELSHDKSLDPVFIPDPLVKS